jgi:hypothetical protein
LAETLLVSSPKYSHTHAALHPEVLTKRKKKKERKKPPLVPWPIYSLNLSPRDSILFPKSKVSLKGC